MKSHLLFADNPSGRRRAQPRGSVAILFIPIIAFIFAMIMFIGNISQVTMQRTMASNSADACSLAGASYIASGIREGAWIAHKAHSVHALMQAIYLVPFCEDMAPYAQSLWNSFTQGPVAPLPYFVAVAQGAIEDGYRNGRPACYAGIWNNLLMRGAPDQEPVGYQNQLYAGASLSGEITWDAGDFRHQATFGVTYPDMPILRLDPINQPYVLWRKQPDTFEYYDCEPKGLGWNAEGPLAVVLANDRLNPLRTENDIKVYEMQDDPYGGMGPSGRIPQVRQGTVSAIPHGPCATFVCGFAPDAFFTMAEAIPRVIEVTNNQVIANVTHIAQSPSGLWKSARMSAGSIATFGNSVDVGPLNNPWLEETSPVILTGVE